MDDLFGLIVIIIGIAAGIYSDKKKKEDNWVEGLALSDAMNRLNDRENHIVKLRFFEGKTQMEIADEIHISQAQVSRLEKTALKTMKNYLALHT